MAERKIASVLREAGYDEAMLGLSLSRGRPVEDMPAVANRLAHLDGGDNKFLESIAVWLDMTAPRYWWQQFDTYRIGVTKQSESTMHTITRRPLTHEDFADIPQSSLEAINSYIGNSGFRLVKAVLPEGFLQRRIVCTNYKALRHIVSQRYDYQLKEWRQFCEELLSQLEHANFLAREKQ